MKKLLLLFIFPLALLHGQVYFPNNSGVKTQENNYQAFTNATLHTSPNTVLKNATLLERNGVIIQVGKEVEIPENTRIYDMTGLHMYSSFIDLNSNFGVKTPIRVSGSSRSSQYKGNRDGYYWNDHILSDYNSLEHYIYNKKQAEEYRNIGFGVVNTYRANGIHQGTSMLVALSDVLPDRNRLIDTKAAEHFSFIKSFTSNQSYPSSVMGTMALIRQFYHDSKWYEQGNADNKDLAIEAALEQKMLPKVFDSDDKLNTLRAVKIGKEINLDFIVLGSGQEYELLKELKANDAKLILPLNFPEAFDAADPLLMKKVTLAQLRSWNQAPMNPAAVAKAEIPFAITSSKLKTRSKFLSNLKKAVLYGLSEENALAALTTIPAAMIKQENSIGSLKKGMLANFIITSGPLFDGDAEIYENWVKGTPHIIKDQTIKNLDGNYEIVLQDQKLTLEIKNSQKKINIIVKKDSLKFKTKSEYKNQWLYLTLINDKEKSYAQLISKITNEGLKEGQGTDFEGKKISWTALASEKMKRTKKEIKVAKHFNPIPVSFPNKAFGFSELPKSKNILLKNATVWTNEKEGVLKNTDVLIIDGKIADIGYNLKEGNYKVIDATGKHLTSGIIDEHSHLGASSINEGGHNSSAEVSIEDVIEPDDIGLFRNLAGGVTTIQILHGSANPIGGRSAIIKLKWGESIDNLLIKNADPFIKFALGENVKQSNWSSNSRFPQTRMGVEQVFVDYFQRAKEYGQKWIEYQSLSKKQKIVTRIPRYDIEMEVLWEILKGERFISSHSYVQSEINMLMKVSERFNFKINTFTHILEGYKVADKMAKHGAGGSTFSDWWSYKNEVKDAIPYNGAIMHNAGVTVAFNSDNSEMSRRLNQEAAKAVKYGGISEEDAWKFVTLNPAKLLHLDDRIGSVKVGKDADFVIWSDHPLSIYAKAEKTFIEGVLYYDAFAIDRQLEDIEKEKQMILGQMLMAKENGDPTRNPQKVEKREFTCETLD
jgi:imidazolonepropionase-like amidohydrolase